MGVRVLREVKVRIRARVGVGVLYGGQGMYAKKFQSL